MNLIERIQEEHPNKNLVYAAPSVLKTRGEIEQFYQEYVAHLKEYGSDEVKSHPDLTAKANISLVIGHCDTETASLWKQAIPELTDNPLLAMTKGYM